MAKKYLKNEKGIVRAITTDSLQLEKPLLNENYDIDVHNRNMDKIDEDLKPIDDSYIIELFQHDGDTTNPRDYYTKVESDEKFASKEEANNALNKANEALQSGSNVKQSLVDKLTSEGLNVSTDNTFEELIGSIALAKKWASGTGALTSAKADFTYSGTTSTETLYYIEIGLNFSPSIIVVTANNTTLEYLAVFNREGGKYSKNNVKCALYNSTSSATNASYKANNSVDLGNNVYRMPLMGSNIANISWIAFE